uniref:Uncharacterized protein n=1 Tax=viral metagenome TaxID=1070528 RepID=A0A6C0BIY8_9ZZZZ
MQPLQQLKLESQLPRIRLLKLRLKLRLELLLSKQLQMQLHIQPPLQQQKRLKAR